MRRFFYQFSTANIKYPPHTSQREVVTSLQQPLFLCQIIILLLNPGNDPLIYRNIVHANSCYELNILSQHLKNAVPYLRCNLSAS